MDAIDIAGGIESKKEPEAKARHHDDADVSEYAYETTEEAEETSETGSISNKTYSDDEEEQYADSSDYEPETVTHVSADEYADEAYDDDDISNDEIVSRVRVNHRDTATEKPRQVRQGRIEPSMGEMEPLSAEDLEDRPAHLREPKKQDKKTKKSRFFKSGKAEEITEKKKEKGKGKEKKNDSAVVQTELFSDTPEDYFQEDEEDTQAVEPEEVIVINVMAKKDEYFSGKDLLPIILQQGMQLGKMSIFHKHADGDGNGPIMFSMANMVKPGTFDISQMDEFTTPGVSFFLQLPNSLGNMKCFEQMLKAANHIRETLHGELKDEHRSVITRQTIEHCRQRIQDFELAQLSKK
ncbi:MAG: cell division protein ZipA [Gammaproteobacteria bacterium]|nr:cell division protein ZipA [Gammaproteobacteria bacterium]